jgi:hypothetical protein
MNPASVEERKQSRVKCGDIKVVYETSPDGVPITLIVESPLSGFVVYYANIADFVLALRKAGVIE